MLKEPISKCASHWAVGVLDTNRAEYFKAKNLEISLQIAEIVVSSIAKIKLHEYDIRGCNLSSRRCNPLKGL